ncbi:uncharacterized protein [Physcomitrium patens]|uniref:uncharacterized protein isoform X2 n=1 Tax=Physcomitrium patens TaxID=3218 RepID=UPI003CCCB2BC
MACGTQRAGITMSSPSPTYSILKNQPPLSHAVKTQNPTVLQQTNKQTNSERASERAKTRNGKESSVLLQSVVNALISHLSSSQLTKLATLTFMDCFSIFIPALHFSLLTTSWTVSPCSFLHYTLVY